MADCGCGVEAAKTMAQQRTLSIALALNATMFIVGMVAGLLAHSAYAHHRVQSICADQECWTAVAILRA